MQMKKHVLLKNTSLDDEKRCIKKTCIMKKTYKNTCT